MPQRPAIEIALDLKEMPSLVKTVRKRPLPPDVTPVIRVAAGSAELTQEFARKYRRPDSHIHEACIFFLQQAVLHSGADSFRTLGVSPGASLDQIRAHRRWLLMWLHPDRNQNRWESALFDRVQTAARALDGGPPAIVRPTRRLIKKQSRGIKQRQSARRSQSSRPRAAKVRPLVLLIVVIGAILLSVATIANVFGAGLELVTLHEIGPAAVRWFH